MASAAQADVLAAVLKLLTVETFQDVRFVCSDGRSVCSNRAFLAARCEYFEKLLYGSLCEAGCTEIRLQAPSEALEHVLYHLHTGSFSTMEQEQCWDIIMETCALAQQYMLPGVVEHIAGRAIKDLQPDSVGVALSFALKHDLQPVIKNIWRAGARLLQHPLKFDSTFTADAVCFCLQHTAWLTTTQCTASSSIADRLSSASSTMSLDGSGNGTSNGRQPCMAASSHTVLDTSSSMREAAAYDAVLAWIQKDVASCEHCQLSRRVDADHYSQRSSSNGGPPAQALLPPEQQPQASQSSNDSRSNSSSCVTGSSALHPGGWAVSGRQSPFKVVQSSASSNSRPCPVECAAGTEALARRGGSDSDCDSTCSSNVSSSCKTAASNPASSPPRPSADAIVTAERTTTADHAAAAGQSCSYCSGYCCEHHEAVLLQLLACLNWHLLEPSALDKLESLALLQPAALLGIYRAHQRSSHLALHGTFNNLTLAGQTKGLRCYTAGGEQVLECQSQCHLTATSNLSFASGKHCWQFVMRVPCDLVWFGVGTDSLVPDIWGGKQSCGWFYGSNDALCHHRHSDRRAYEQHCGFGKWGEGTVVDVYLDMDGREVWFSVDGAEAKLGFSGLPDRVFPAVSLRAPAEVVVRFRAASWLMGQ